MNTTPTTTPSAIRAITIWVRGWSVSHAETPDGIAATMLAKMISEIPLPIPRCVMSSPSHITRVVPATRLIMMT